jgi:serine/threonine-protein kinase
LDHAVLETDRHRYVVVSPLAEGGMGAIYLGRRISAGAGNAKSRTADVVLKQLLPEHTADPQLIEMFLREARVSASLEHPNIVRTLDLVNAGDDYFIVLEYVRGGDLRTLLRRARRRQQRFSIDAALHIASEVLSALSYAHGKRDRKGQSLGIIHRDVTPSNILLGADGLVKLTDFGIAKAPSQGSVMFKVKGKLGYMAPEQSRGESVDVRADIFAVGVVLYEALVGERLFAGTQSQAAGVFSQPIRAPSKRRPEVSAAIDELVMRALSLDPAGRYRSADEFRAVITRITGGKVFGSKGLSADLHRVCGDDSARWLSLDVPHNATLNDGADGTGVIATGDEEFDSDRPPTLSRGYAIPSRELTSVVTLGDSASKEDPDSDLATTRLADDPFAPSAAVASSKRAGLAFDPTQFLNNPPARAFDEDEGAATRVQPNATLSRRAAREPEPVARRPKPEPVAPEPVAHKPATKPPLGPAAPRAQFQPPKPRASVPPPSGTFDVPPPSARSETSQQIPTRMTLTNVDESPASARQPAPGSRSASASMDSSLSGTSRSSASRRAAGPSSLAALERNLSGRPLMKSVLAVIAVLLLVGLGIGLGLLLSGPGLDPESAPDPGAAVGNSRGQGTPSGAKAEPASPPAR